MTIIRSGSSSFGKCWVEDHGSYYMVYIMDGKSCSGPYSSLGDALEYYSRYCI